MKRTRTASVVATALAALFFTAVFVFAATTTLFVYPGHLEGWQPNAVSALAVKFRTSVLRARSSVRRRGSASVASAAAIDSTLML